MSPPLSDQELTEWARGPLIYEARMLAFTAARLAERQYVKPDVDSNVLLESFGVHTRCLGDFLWGKWQRHKLGAFASDFCRSGAWTAEYPDWPPGVKDVRDKERLGRELVHLSYHRLAIEGEDKAWSVGQLYAELAYGLKRLAELALPERMDDAARVALADPLHHGNDVGPPSVATGAIYGSTALEYLTMSS